MTWYWRKYRTRYRTVHILSSIVYGTGCRPGGSVATVFLSSHTSDWVRSMVAVVRMVVVEAKSS